MTPRALRRAAEHKARKQAAKAVRQAASLGIEAVQSPASETNTLPVVATLPPAVSEAQLAANRANAQHSTGPATPEGKTRCALNALKHGLTSKTVLLPHEDNARYQRELEECIENYNPATPEELRLVQSLNDCVWRIDRVQRLQMGILLKGHIECADKYAERDPRERAQLIDAEAYLKYEKQLRNLSIQEARIRRVMEKDAAELKRLKAVRQRQKMADLQVPHKTERSAPPVSNGFEFAEPQTAPPIALEHPQKQAA